MDAQQPNYYNDGENIFRGLPTNCPHCFKNIYPFTRHKGIKAKPYPEGYQDYMLILSCPNQECQMSFLAEYIQIGSAEYEFFRISRPKFQIKNFTDIIKNLSNSFVDIHRQAQQAEQMNLDQIAGVGYRKALEFLVKDYLISLEKDNAHVIKEKSLGKCIQQSNLDSKIKSVAERAIWLGNDETHYLRKWEEKNIHDLKDVIQLTVNWVEMEILTQKLIEEMPKGK